MTKMRRPFQDETLFLPCYRTTYAGTVLGHGTGDPHEEPVKLTQALHEKLFQECVTDWIPRLLENTIAADMFIKGELEEEKEKLARLTGTLEDTGLDETMDGIESGSVDAIDGVETAIGIAGDETALEAIGDVLTLDMMTTYGFHPPVMPLPISLGPAIIVMLFGGSTDSFYNYMDTFTVENIPYFEDWHYEDGIQTGRISYIYENAEEILARRHMRTGEPIRTICVQKPLQEGEPLVMDITKDIRNERLPENSGCYMYGFPVSNLVTPDAQSVCRNIFGIFPVMGIALPACGFPYRAYVAWYPFPAILDMMLELPIELILPKLIGVLTGVNFAISRHNLTHLEAAHEILGQEILIGQSTEYSNGFIRYGMDNMRVPQSYVQSKRIYGQEAQLRQPCEYPFPEKTVMSIGDLDKSIVEIRKEHPEWLTNIKGLLW